MRKAKLCRAGFLTVPARAGLTPCWCHLIATQHLAIVHYHAWWCWLALRHQVEFHVEWRQAVAGIALEVIPELRGTEGGIIGATHGAHSVAFGGRDPNILA